MNNPPGNTSNPPDVEEEFDSIAIDRLVAQAGAGDEEAFGQVVQFYYNRIYNVIYRVTRHPEDTRELCQATWVKAWQRLAEYKHEAKFYTWIYRIAVNTALDFLRKRKRRPEVPLEPAIGDDGDHLALDRQRDLAHEETAVDEINRREIRTAFAQALDGLSPEHRAALVLREVEGMSYDEIAEVTKSRKGTVMSRLFYARRHMQQALGEFL